MDSASCAAFCSSSAARTVCPESAAVPEQLPFLGPLTLPKLLYRILPRHLWSSDRRSHAGTHRKKPQLLPRGRGSTLGPTRRPARRDSHFLDVGQGLKYPGTVRWAETMIYDGGDKSTSSFLVSTLLQETDITTIDHLISFH